MTDLPSGSQRDLRLRHFLPLLGHPGALSKAFGTEAQISHLKTEGRLDQWFSSDDTLESPGDLLKLELFYPNLGDSHEFACGEA